MEKPLTYIFDFDGTLADTTNLIADSQMEVLQSLGVDSVDREDLWAMNGMRLDVSFSLITGETDPVIQSEAVEHYHRVAFRRTLKEGKLFDGAIETLRELKRRGHKIGIMTMRRREGFDRILKQTGLSELTDAFVCDSDVAHSKPATDMVDVLMDSLGAAPEDTIIVGDTSFDIEMANNCGAAGVAYTGGGHTRKVLELQQPHAIISSIRELLEVKIG